MDIARQAKTKVRRIVVPGVLGTAMLLGIAGLLWRSSAAAAPAVDRSAVWTERVRRGDLVRQVPVQGTLIPEHVQWLSAASPARVARIAVRPGAQVEADTVVVVLENSDLELAALEAERQAAAAEAALVQLDVKTDADAKLQESTLVGLRSELEDARRHAHAADRLAPEGLIGDLEHRDALNKAQGLSDRVESEEGRRRILTGGRPRQLAAQQAEVKRLGDIAKFRRRQLAALEIHAGIRGIVQDVPLESGQWVAAGTLLAKVAEPDRLKAEVRVAEGDAKDVHKGLAVRFEAPSGDRRGHVERVDPAVVRGSVRIEVTLDDPLPSGARADQAVSGYVEIEKLDNVLFVARPAGAQDGMTTVLFRLTSDHAHASRVTARLGRGSAREVEVLGGLAEGDEIVVSDVSAWSATATVALR